MIRTLIAATALCLTAGAANADVLAGGPQPNIIRHGAGTACQSTIATSTEGGVRMHRGTTSGCTATPAQTAAPRIAYQPSRVQVRVTTNVELRERRLGTSPYVLGSPRSHDDGYYGTNPYVLGAPGGF
jgi:hypothetical protein